MLNVKIINSAINSAKVLQKTVPEKIAVSSTKTDVLEVADMLMKQPKESLLAKSVFKTKKNFYKFVTQVFNFVRQDGYKEAYALQTSLRVGFKNIQGVCKKTDRSLLGKIKLQNKITNKAEEAYLTLRKIDLNEKYSSKERFSIFDAHINAEIDSRIRSTKKLKSSADIVDTHNCFSKDSYLLEVLDKNYIPIGVHFLDINPSATQGKGIMSFANFEYRGVGTVLTEVKALTAAITGSDSVRTIGAWDSMPFQLKMGYEVDKKMPKCVFGEHIFMPQENINKIKARYENTEIYENLKRALSV